METIIKKYKTDNGELWLGDCLDLMKNIPDKSINMILCDLPYGKTKAKWDIVIPFEPLWDEYWRICKNNAPIVLTATQPFASQLIMSQLKYFRYDWIWDKVKGTGFLNAKKMPMRNHESICVFYKNTPLYNPQKTMGHPRKVSFKRRELQTEVYNNMKNDTTYDSTERYPRSIQIFSTDTQTVSLHPTQKPVALFEYLIKTYTIEGDLVLDNCSGSGTTAIACENLNRYYICIEKEETYFEISKKRIMDLKENKNETIT